MSKEWRIGLAGFLLFAAGAFAQDSSLKPSALDRAALERWFEETMSGASLVGHFVVAGQDAPAKGEKYRISKIAKMSDGRWMFNAQMGYGDREHSISMPFDVQWAGDTPVITLTDQAIEGMQGRFTARVLIYGERYAGTWQHGPAGGHMWGKVVKAGADKPPGN